MIQTISERITPPSPPRASILPTYADLIRSGELTVEQAIEAMNNPPRDPASDILVAGLKRDMEISQAIWRWWETVQAVRAEKAEQ